MRNTFSDIELFLTGPWPKDYYEKGMGVREYIDEMKRIKALEHEIKMLSFEEGRLESELRKRKPSLKKRKASMYEIRRDIPKIVKADETTIKMCAECIFLNKKYSELFEHKHICICKKISEPKDEKNFERKVKCICKFDRLDDKFILK